MRSANQAPNNAVRAPKSTAGAGIKPGDAVRFNGYYVGKIESVNGETAVIIEANNKAFGRPVRWRLALVV